MPGFRMTVERVDDQGDDGLAQAAEVAETVRVRAAGTVPDEGEGSGAGA